MQDEQDHLDEPLVFAKEDPPLQGREPLPEDINGLWTVLIVDDEEDVHKLTRITLKGYTFQGRGIRLLSAYSGHDVKTIMAEEKDIAMVLLDVVMEEEDTGLKLVEYIRSDSERYGLFHGAAPRANVAHGGNRFLWRQGRDFPES